VIDPTDNMIDAYEQARRAYWEAMDHTAEVLSVKEHGREANRAGLAAAFELVERDHDVQAKPTVHLAVKGDSHVHCCGADIVDLPDEDDVTLDPHGATCKGPS
jgi:hypothetical protein